MPVLSNSISGWLQVGWARSLPRPVAWSNACLLARSFAAVLALPSFWHPWSNSHAVGLLLSAVPGQVDGFSRSGAEGTPNVRMSVPGVASDASVTLS